MLCGRVLFVERVVYVGCVRKEENMRDKVKPCPFCGSYDIQIDKCTMRARCKNCFSTGGLIAKLVKNPKLENAALEAWNTRYEENE